MLQINLTYFVFAGAASEVTEYSFHPLFAVVIPELFFALSTLFEPFKNSILTQAKELFTQLSPEESVSMPCQYMSVLGKQKIPDRDVTSKPMSPCLYISISHYSHYGRPLWL